MNFSVCIRDINGEMVFSSENTDYCCVCTQEELIKSEPALSQAALNSGSLMPLILITHNGKTEVYPLPYYSIEIYL